MPGMQCQGCSARDVRVCLHSPLPPSPAPSGERSPPGHSTLEAGIEPVPLPAAAPGNAGGEQGQSFGGALQAATPGQRIRPSAATRQRPRRGAPLESQKPKPRRMIAELWKGEKRRRVRCYLRWLRLYRSSTPGGSGCGDPCGSRPRGCSGAPWKAAGCGRSSSQSSFFKELAGGKGLGGSCAALSSVSQGLIELNTNINL